MAMVCHSDAGDHYRLYDIFKQRIFMGIFRRYGRSYFYRIAPNASRSILLCGNLLPLLLEYGLLEFLGPIFRPVMRPLFTLPGRSTVDNLASFIGDGTVGVMITSKQYDEGIIHDEKLQSLRRRSVSFH